MSLSIKIAFIGGGSRHWTPVMLQDLALTQGLAGEVALYDINHAAAAANAERGTQIFSLPDAVSSFTVSHHETLEGALTNADIVFISILPGPMTCFANDLDIPLSHGMVQTVGDTIGPGGLSRCLRTVPLFAEFAHTIAACCPEAWVLNYTNPLTVATQTLTSIVPDLKTIGCCHEVFGTRDWLRMMTSEVTGATLTHRNEIEVEVVGLNHFTVFPWARYKSQDLKPIINSWIETQDDFFGDKTQNALDREANGRFGSCDGLIQLDFLRRFDVIGAAGDRHLVEFVPWYCTSVETLRRWGVSVTGSAQRMQGWTPGNVEHVPDRPITLTRSKEEGIDLVKALCGLGNLVTNVNVPNRGQIPWLPEEHVVETLASVTADRVTPHTTSPLPTGLTVQMSRAAEVQALTLAAALTCDFDLALHALLADPLCQVDTDTAATVLEELIDANRAYLPAGWTA